jgi:hypothetical protein
MPLRLLKAYRLLIISGLLALPGCADEQVEYVEVKDIDERLTDEELESFIRIIEALPDQKLPPLPPVFAEPSEWAPSRTLPVNELLAEERKLVDERWNVETLARRLERNRRLARLLQKERLTTEQFVGLTLTIGLALSRGTLRDDQDLDDIRDRGREAIERLNRNTRSFAAHTPEGRHYVLSQAAWLARLDRAEHLQLVPRENVELIAPRREKLAGMFPPEYTANPLDAIADPLEEWGTPFEELAESGRDDELTWDRADALIGTDRLEPVSTDSAATAEPAL